MSRGVRPFTRSDVTNAVTGVVQGGVQVGRVEIEIESGKSKITVFAGAPEAVAPPVTATPQNDDVNEWDGV